MAYDMKRYENVLRKQTGKAVRPARFDGYVNAINRYGTAKDDTEQYFYRPEPVVDDMILEMFYENNGLFAKIIDTPAEEAVKHGFTLEGVEDDDIVKFYSSALDELDWEEIAMTGLKWARLFGGSLAVMLINDGRGLEEPVDWKHIRSIDDIVIFDRSMITPDRTSLYRYDPEDPFRTRGSRLGSPEWYEVFGPNGSFVVHDSRCLAFRNGVLPFNATNENYQLWGIPEYVRISRAIRNAEIAHESAPKMLSKSVQPVYKMKDLAMELATEEGEDKVLRRLQAIDMARGLLNSITIDSEGEDYSFQSFGFAGVSEVIDSSCNWLSALTNIPQTILFGRSPAGMNSTGESDFENYYNFVERIQKRMLKSNLRYLLSVIFTAGKHTGEIKKVPKIKVEFNPLWSLSETEEVQLESSKLQNELTRANIAQTYISNEVLDPKEVRVELGKEDPLDPETMLDDMDEEELLKTAPQGQQGLDQGMGNMIPQGGQEAPQIAPPAPAQDAAEAYYATYGNSPETAPEATKLPQDMNPEDEPDHEDAEGEDLDWITANGTHIPLNDEGKAVGGPLAGSDFHEAKNQKHESAPDYSCKLTSPKRPSRDDFSDEESYQAARKKYREARTQYHVERDQIVELAANAPRQYKTIESVKEWGEQNGVDLSEFDSTNIDSRVYDDVVSVLNEMFNRFPQAKETQDRYKKWGIYNDEPSDDYLFEARAGLSIGHIWSDYETGLRDVYDQMADGTLTRGDGTVKTVLRHEYGHKVDSSIREKFSTFELNGMKDKEEIQRRNEQRDKYNSELIQLTKDHCKTEYAFINEYEAFAEGFAEYTSNPSSEYGKAFGEFLERWI